MDSGEWSRNDNGVTQQGDTIRVRPISQLKKENKKDKHEMHNLLASNLKIVLHKKTEEASLATKELKWLLESRKALLLKRGGKNGNNTATQLMLEIYHEAEVTEQLNELCVVYERQIELCSCQEKEVDIFEKDFDISDLSDQKAQVVSISSMVEQLRLQKTELDHGKSQMAAGPEGNFGARKKPMTQTRNILVECRCCKT